MKLSRRQQIALMVLSTAFDGLEWTAINAAVKMFGERAVNGRVIGSSLVRKGLATARKTAPAYFDITDKGREVAKTINVTVQIEQVKP